MRTLFILIFYFLVSNVCAQTQRIDSIKKSLLSQTREEEVNSLNALSTEYYFYWVHADSSFKYSNLAFEKAAQIKYNIGQAEALLTQAGVYGRLLGRPPEMEKKVKDAFAFIKDEKDFKILSKAYYYLGIAHVLQGRYHLAEEPFEKAKQLALQSRDKFSIGWAEQGIGFMYFKSGKYWKSFPHLIEAQQIGREINDSVLTTLSLVIIARTFNLAGDPQTALNYYYQAFQYSMPFIRLWGHHEDMAYAHLQLKQYDSAVYYQQLNTYDIQTMTTDSTVRKKFSAFSRGYSIDIQLALKQYDSVLVQVLPLVKELKVSKDVIPRMQTLWVLGKVYQGKGNYQKALLYTRQLYSIASRLPNHHFLKDADQLLASLFEQLNNSDSAYFYFKQYTALKDSMETAQFAGRTALYLAASEAENKIRLLKKDKEINDQQLVLNKKELQKQSQLRNILLASLAVFILISILVFRNIILKRKNEKLQHEQAQSSLKRKAMELKMQALRAQMNPHFIFNCLSAIDNLVQTNQADKATAYLSRFAKLIRSVLDSSKNNLVSFQKDFETLRLYLEMEQFRCNNKFDYKLSADNELLQGDYKVPPLIIQPFVENAIHHGLLNKQDNNRQLKVTAELKDDHIIYLITDNGIGRKQAAVLKERNRPGQKSYGIDITRERINLYNKNGLTNDVEINDLENDGVCLGTKAIVRINSSEN